MYVLAIVLKVIAGIFGFTGLCLMLFAPAFDWNPRLVAPSMILLFMLAAVSVYGAESIQGNLGKSESESTEKSEEEKYKCAYCKSDSEKGKGKCANCGSEVYIRIREDS